MHPAGAAYAFCTSGTTGTPKAVVVEHGALAAFLDGMGTVVGVDQRSTCLAFASFGFDVSVEEILLPLSCGATVVVADEAERSDPRRLEELVRRHSVDVVNLPVALLGLVDPVAVPSIRTLVTGSESPTPEQIRRWATPHRHGRRVLNAYGTTETAVTSIVHEADGTSSGAVPIGVPLCGTSVFVVNPDLDPVPAGSAGELLIGGSAVARGYVGEPAATAERFVPDHLTCAPGERLYRTGDLVVERPDGRLTFLGRMDRQVKIRGQRVEPGEVEATLAAHPLVGGAAVEAVAVPGATTTHRLVAFCSPAADPAPDLQAWCTGRLPAAMVPSAVHWLDVLPLTASGKIDRDALLTLIEKRESDQVAASSMAEQTVLAGGSLESAVAAAMADVLHTPVEGADADFFDLGGHSVAAMQLAALLRDRAGRDVSVEDVYRGRTVAGLAGRVREAPEDRGDVLPTGSSPELSDAQRRLWFLDRLADDTSAYNIDVQRELTGPLDVAALAVALAAVQDRHEVLRWRIRETDDGLGAVDVAPAGTTVPVAVHEVPGGTGLEDGLRAQSSRRFDLTRGPLWAASLFRTGPDAHVLALTFHHAVFDGWSERPLLEDLASAYRAVVSGEGSDLARPAVTFADYVVWKRHRDAARGPDDLRWWVEELTGASEFTDLPTDRPRPAVQTYRGARVATWIGSTERHLVDELASTWAVGAPALFLTALGELCHRVCGQDDLVIGMPVADRRHEAFWDLLGFFVDVMPVRFRDAGGRTFTRAVRDRAAGVTEALAHPSASLENVVAALGLRRSPARQPLVQVLFNAFTFPEAGLDLPGVVDRRLDDRPPGSPFDLTVYVAARGACYLLEVVYNPDLFDRVRMERFVDAYRDLLSGLCANPQAPMRDVWVDVATLRTGRRQSVDPIAAQVVGHREAPGTPREAEVAAVWSEVLARQVGVTDNFFDLGGTSLAALGVQAGLRERLGVPVPLVDLFRFPTVRSLAAHLDGTDRTTPTVDRGQARVAARRQRRALAEHRGHTAQREIG